MVRCMAQRMSSASWKVFIWKWFILFILYVLGPRHFWDYIARKWTKRAEHKIVHMFSRPLSLYSRVPMRTLSIHDVINWKPRKIQTKPLSLSALLSPVTYRHDLSTDGLVVHKISRGIRALVGSNYNFLQPNQEEQELVTSRQFSRNSTGTKNNNAANVCNAPRKKGESLLSVKGVA